MAFQRAGIDAAMQARLVEMAAQIREALYGSDRSTRPEMVAVSRSESSLRSTWKSTETPAASQFDEVLKSGGATMLGRCPSGTNRMSCPACVVTLPMSESCKVLPGPVIVQLR